MKTRIAVLAVVLFAGLASLLAQTGLFHATPLTDFKAGQLYLGKFPGYLYEQDSNEPPADHDLDGRRAAEQVQPINGKIVVAALGMSNWVIEVTQFIEDLASNPNVNHTTLVVVNCAQNGKDARYWAQSPLPWTTCASILAADGYNESAVQVVLWKDGDISPRYSLAAHPNCVNTASSPTTIVADACQYEQYVASIARQVKQNFPNVKQMFLHSRIYAGYATSSLNPEPYAYEYGFGTKWLIEAQIKQVRTGTKDAVAGDLSYESAPWLAWGPYFWASGTTPRSDGLVWLRSDFASDGTHPSAAGAKKVSSLMQNFYLTSPYSPWFAAK